MTKRLREGWCLLACVLFAGRLLTGAALPAEGTARSQDIRSGVYSNEQAARGQQKYDQVCSTCHEADLSGTDRAPSLVGSDFLSRWDLQTIGDLMDRIKDTMPQDDAGSLTAQESADLTSYILQANDFPSGQADLKPGAVETRRLAITRKAS